MRTGEKRKKGSNSPNPHAWPTAPKNHVWTSVVTVAVSTASGQKTLQRNVICSWCGKPRR